MIIVKSTKADATEAVSANQYRIEEKAASKKPFAAGLLLAGVVFYLRDMFPSWASLQPHEPAPDDANEGDLAQPVRIAAPQLVPAFLPELDPQASTETAPDSAPPVGSSARLVGLELPNERIEVPMPDMPVFALEGGITIRPRFTMATPMTAAVNDNGPATAVAQQQSAGADDEPADSDQDEDDDDTRTPNRAPVLTGPVQLFDIFGCAAVVIALSDFLRNASDPDGDPLSISNLTVSSGEIVKQGNVWLYDPAGLGPVTFTYVVGDGALSAIQTAYLNVLKNKPQLGTEGDDTLVGTDCADEIVGSGGSDLIDARAGIDLIDAGAGNDHIVAGAGDDVVHGGSGDDIIMGGAGNDTLWGGEGNDRLFGDEGDDILQGEAGNDQISGGSGDDLAFGGVGDDDLRGEAGADKLEGDEGDDLLSGGAGSDVVMGGAGNDLVDGGEGDDLLGGGAGEDHVAGGEGSDTIIGDADGADDTYDGGEGFDTLSFAATEEAVVIDLAQQTATGVEIGADAIVNIETIIGGGGDDTFIVAGEPVQLGGGEGADTFDFSGLAASAAPGSNVIYEIIDFMVGDRIKMSHNRFVKEVVETLENHFEEVYGDSADEDDLPIRIRHERTDDVRTTYVEADLDRDDNYELTIQLEGHHVLMIVDQA